MEYLLAIRKNSAYDRYSADTMNTIVCPNCGKTVEISLAIKQQIEQSIRKEESEKLEEKIKTIQEEMAAKAEKKVQEAVSVSLQDSKRAVEEKDARIEKLIQELLKTNEQARALKQKDSERELEMQKHIAKEEEKIRLEATQKAQEEQHLKLLEKEKQLHDLLKANEDMRRKLQQGSQQTQGEVFELAFEELVRSQYPNDKIAPVEKGVKGADLVQQVWDGNGNYVGKILWELKNTKTWSEPWVNKLKSDKRSSNADEAVLISEVLPTNMRVAGFRNGIWVTQQPFVIPLADTIRAKLIQLYYVKNSVKGKDEKMEILYRYLSGTEFKHRVEAIVESFTNMQEEIEKEKRYFSNKWARDEKNIRQVIDNTYGMHGDLKGIIGSILPQIKGLEVMELADGHLPK